uniref:LisH domain-containing protein n=1 Tax=Parascaris univalens TaxID=6257 RepID=A0A915C9X2_PARUN
HSLVILQAEYCVESRVPYLALPDMGTVQCEPHPHPYRKVFDTLVVGYLNRQNYSETTRCLISESPCFKNAARLSDSSLPINDVVHGKHLEQIMQMFIERGHFDVHPMLLDFGNRMRALTNEFIALTNPQIYWSDAQKTLYGKRVPPPKSNFNEGSGGATQIVASAKGNAVPELTASVSNSFAHNVGDGWTSARRYAFYFQICSSYCP